MLAVERLSRETDESTSIRRQREHMTRWSELNEHTIVGHAEDADVSGTVSVFDRAGFGPWLTEERAGEYDTIAAVKIDRLSRSLIDFVKLIEWADAHGKNVVAVEDGVDTGTPTGKLMAHLLGVFAEFERQRIRERSMDSQRDALRNGTWHGGTPPWGYMPVRGADAKWRLVIDAEYLPVVQEVVARVIEGESSNSVAADLNQRGVLTSEDRHAERTGRPLGSVRHANGCSDAREQSDAVRQCDCSREPSQWSSANLNAMLRSRAMLGETVDGAGNVKVRDDAGMPVRRAEPLISEAEWKRVQDALDARRITPRRSRMVSPLSGLLTCGVCGLPYYRVNDGRGVDRYRCKSATGKAGTVARCGNPSILGDQLAEAIEDIIVSHIGNETVTRRVFRKGADHSRELEQVNRAINDLRDDSEAGLFPDRQEYQRRMAALLERQGALSALPNEPDRWIDEPTGETFADRWNAAETDMERRDFLLSTGAVFTLTARDGTRPGEGAWIVRMDRGEISRDYQIRITRLDGEPVLASVLRPLPKGKRTAPGAA
ncbi:integrase [Dactylosporangium sucinum]|uniref:Integrase n=1 Tax=Dactylosporangium sucinum TaxID=1424081 RepID=A0A917X241_9ACTN|nr:integrase [Dactylosporangium sucinum]